MQCTATVEARPSLTSQKLPFARPSNRSGYSSPIASAVYKRNLSNVECGSVQRPQLSTASCEAKRPGEAVAFLLQ